MIVWLPIALQLLAMLPELIHTAEVAFGHSERAGAAKKQLVLDTVSTGLEVAGRAGAADLTPQNRQLIVDVAGELTDAVVAGYNAAQAWRSSEAPQSS